MATDESPFIGPWPGTFSMKISVTCLLGTCTIGTAFLWLSWTDLVLISPSFMILWYGSHRPFSLQESILPLLPSHRKSYVPHGVGASRVPVCIPMDALSSRTESAGLMVSACQALSGNFVLWVALCCRSALHVRIIREPLSKSKSHFLIRIICWDRSFSYDHMII